MSETQLSKTEPSKKLETSTFIRPQYEVIQAEDYKIKVYMPGVNKEGVHIIINDKTLTVEGQKAPLNTESLKVVYKEIPTANYRLRLDLNIPVDEQNITAKTENGVLIVNLPIAEAAKPRKIEIS